MFGLGLPVGWLARLKQRVAVFTSALKQKKPRLGDFFAASLGLLYMAEGQGFEPWEPLDSPVFKTGAFDHSATPPY